MLAMQNSAQDAYRPGATQEYLTSKEAAAYRRLAEITLRKERMSGTGPRYVKHGRRVLYVKADLDTYLRAHIVEPRKALPHA